MWEFHGQMDEEQQAYLSFQLRWAKNKFFWSYLFYNDIFYTVKRSF